jgi:hypothetical protein
MEETRIKKRAERLLNLSEPPCFLTNTWPAQCCEEAGRLIGPKVPIS